MARRRAARGDWLFLWPYFRREDRRLAALGVVLLGATAAALASPFVVREFIDGVVTGTTTAFETTRLVVVFGVLGVARYALSAAEAGLAESVAWRSTNRLREDVLRHALDLPLERHRSATPGEWVERVDGDISLLSNLFSRFVITVVGEVLVVVGVVAALFTVDRRIGLLFLVCLTAGLLGLRWIAGWGRDAYRDSRAAVGRFMGYVEERLRGVEDLQALGAVGHALAGLAERHRHVLRTDLRSALVGSSLVWASASVFTAVVTALALGLAGLRFGQGALTIGTVYLVFSFTQQIQEPLIRLSHQLQDYQRAMAGLSRTREILELPAERRTGPVSLAGDRGAVTFDDVTFGYVPGHPVVSGLSFELRPGQTLGVVGRTGAGKSTVARLLAGLVRPESGQVRLGGVDTADVGTAELRDAVALVTQDVFLFDASVRDNVTLMDPDVTDERLTEALTALGLTDWVRRLPHGLDTRVSDHVVSAGEAQLLALTRVMVRDPAVVVLDEASARLDPETERRLDTALRPVLAGRTAVVVAHRLSTLDRVDLIAVVDDGRLTELGPREELMADQRSRFAAMLRQGGAR
ncbi:ABC transporter ATP-binding protein [Promicromonospora sp. MS192]|uniref:ABC transporter ATP-binding protein n=1 Tax=Promicromonospora sp. MS192 TaxID=3412684 RepID=UPI003C2B9B44